LVLWFLVRWFPDSYVPSLKVVAVGQIKSANQRTRNQEPGTSEPSKEANQEPANHPRKRTSEPGTSEPFKEVVVLYAMKHATQYLTAMVCVIAMIAACHKDNGPSSPNNPTDTLGTKFITANYIDLSKVGRISKFRSGIGHDYSDDSEHCRSMKHYFEPRDTVDWASVRITVPATGTVFRVQDEWAGARVEWSVDGHDSYSIAIFHVALAHPLNVGDRLTAGDLLGMHIGSQTMSDISVRHNSQLVSYFGVMPDSVFAQYVQHGIPSRDSLLIPRSARDASPLQCNGETFADEGTIPNWAIVH
jgi:hypothetical protein